MKVITLSFAAAVITASIGFAEAKQAQPDRSRTSPLGQDDVRSGRSVGPRGQGKLYDMDRRQSYGVETRPPARGPYEVY
jgi:hypothetical protein